MALVGGLGTVLSLSPPFPDGEIEVDGNTGFDKKAEMTSTKHCPVASSKLTMFEGPSSCWPRHPE